MSDNQPPVLTWMTISMGIVSVIVGIVFMTWINSFANLSLPPYIVSAIGTALGVGGWMLWNFSFKKRDD